LCREISLRGKRQGDIVAGQIKVSVGDKKGDAGAVKCGRKGGAEGASRWGSEKEERG